MKKVANVLFAIGEAFVIIYSLARIILGVGKTEDYAYLFFAIIAGVLAVVKYFSDQSVKR
jgi:hypothetical protein